MRKLAFLMILALLCLALPFACAEEEISYGELFGDPATPRSFPLRGRSPRRSRWLPRLCRRQPLGWRATAACC